MSDCSSEAMKPKADDVFKAYFGDGREITTFCGYPLREAFEKLQRYQQLVKVAQEMLSAIENRNAYPRQHYRRKLEALGVSVDG